MLKLTRNTQQGIVVSPKGQQEKALVIRVVDIVPNSVCLEFEGADYEIVRTEIYNQRRSETDEFKQCVK